MDGGAGFVDDIVMMIPRHRVLAAAKPTKTINPLQVADTGGRSLQQRVSHYIFGNYSIYFSLTFELPEVLIMGMDGELLEYCSLLLATRSPGDPEVQSSVAFISMAGLGQGIRKPHDRCAYLQTGTWLSMADYDFFKGR